jgi:hypothetical protein
MLVEWMVKSLVVYLVLQLVEMMVDGRELQLGGKKVVLTDEMMVGDLVE